MKDLKEVEVEIISIDDTISIEGGQMIPRLGPIFPLRVLIWILS
ncbi:hypothetical protein [Zobellia barbeyronii]|nr:hypothetical protein [Zobellia barbeyronii]